MSFISNMSFILWPFLCGALLLMAVVTAGLCFSFFWRLKRAEKVLNAAKRETLDASKILYNTPYPLVHYIPREGILFSNSAALIAFPDLPQKSIAHPILAGLDEITNINRDMRAASREYEYEGIFYHQNAIPVESMGRKSIVLYCYDISAIKRVQTALEDSRKQAERANDAKSDFLANMSHELRTPMNGIIGLSGLLQEANIGGEKNTALAKAIYDSSCALLVLLNDILDFSKIEAGELALESIPFSPADILQQVENLQKPAASHKNLSFSVKTSPDVPFLKGDPIRLQQILNNLIGNAIKFTEQGSVIASCYGSISHDGRFLMQLEISDTGIGIPADKQEKIFTKFTQADISTARKYGGTGLGLSITRQLISMMGGILSLESQEGKGSTFKATIPFEISEESFKKESVPFIPDDIRFKGKVLLVDDHPTNILFLRSVLERLGLQDIDDATTGSDALTYALQNAYDLILMDCQMPEMDGLEVSRRIRSSTSPSQSTPIIALTANVMNGTAEKCKEAGMNDYLSKPVDHTKFMEVLRRYLEAETENSSSQVGREYNGLTSQNIFEKESSNAQPPKIFDWSRLEEFTGKDRSATNRIIDTFLEQMEDDTTLLKDAFKTNDYDLWKRLAHKLYGACANVGAEALSVICDKVHTEKLPDSDINTIHAEILEEYRKLSDFLTQKEAA
ncbi:MAG: response regulator [Alphaproteobacteria bacterium]|nr:response regulator [Alphaproteobacteria bacterium]